MKVDMSKISVNSQGFVTIIAEDVDDIGALANIIRVGDRIRSQVRRKVQKISTTGKAESRQIITSALVKITEVEYQPGVNEMNLRGTLKHDLEDAKKGSFQRILIELNRPFDLFKKCWDKFTYNEIKEAADPASNASIAAVIMKAGLANICIVGRHTTINVAKVSKSIPKVRAFGAGNKEDKIKFYSMTANALISHVQIQTMKAIIIASPGFIHQEFVAYLSKNANKLGITNLFSENKIIETNCSTGFPEDLEQIITQPEIASHVDQLKTVDQVKSMDKFLKRLNKADDTTALGERVIELLKQNAVSELYVTDQYIRSLPLQNRLDFLDLKEQAENSDVVVVIFSVQHQSGIQLQELGGIAAILRYAVHAEEDEGFDEEFD